MAELELDRMSIEEFLDWQIKQDKLYDLVDGLPRLSIKMMTGATHNHDRVTINSILSLGNQLQDKTCRPCTADIAVKIPAGNIRRPDVLVECGEADPKGLTAAKPVMVIEVLSPSTMEFDRFRKLEEYKTVESLMVILLVNTEAPQITVHQRNGKQWKVETVENLDAVIKLPEIEAELLLRDLYKGVVFASS